MKHLSNIIPSPSSAVTPNLLRFAIQNEEATITPDDSALQSNRLDNRYLQPLTVPMRSLAERVHLNIECLYKRYREKENRDSQQVEQSINYATQEIDVYNASSFLNPILDLSNENIVLYQELDGSLDKENNKLTEEIDSKIERLDASLDEERSRLWKDIELRTIAIYSKMEEIDTAIEVRLRTILSKIADISNQRDNLSIQLICKDTCPSTTEVGIIESKIKGLDILADAEWKRHSETMESRSVERDKAYEASRKEIENEENNSHQLSEELRKEQRSLESFKDHWYDYIKTHRENIRKWFSRQSTRLSDAIVKISKKISDAFSKTSVPPWASNSRTNEDSFPTETNAIIGQGATQVYDYGKQGTNLAVANASAALIPVSMGYGAVGTAANKAGLTPVANHYDNKASKTLQIVANNWTAANEGPMGRAFDTQVHVATSLLEPLIGHNQQFLADWITGNHPARIVYTPDSIQVRDMLASPNVQRAISEFYAKGAPKEGTKFNYGTFQAFWETIVDPRTANWKSTAMQVGGYDGATITNNGDTTMTIKIKNTAGARSFFYHLLPNQSTEIGPMHSVKQIFEWTIPIDSSRLPKINQ